MTGHDLSSKSESAPYSHIRLPPAIPVNTHFIIFHLFQFVVPPLGGETPPKGGTTN
ncbi:Uncharacterized protein dnm_100790 [Desulfonema magnum]|uniref:Uncharacterized protein n=1 Tax=Desulfonema magnum TaxID=45655 RepID=A0A975C1H1_9BACT|nr:Uncharacterized protein dnm_100790 [Desulfonema magnum]